MGTPWTLKPVILVTEDDQETCFALRVPHRGIIRTIRFRQISGADAACEVDLYNKEDACPPGSSMSSSGQTEGDRAMYKVIDTMTLASGGSIELFNQNYQYRNQDGTYSVPVRRLYLALTPGTTGTKEWEISLDIEMAPLTS